MFGVKVCNFSPSGEKLAQGGTDGVLRVWDTATGTLDHEYQPAKHLAAATSCMQYSPKSTGTAAKNKDHGEERSSLLAMGTFAGTVLVYSPEKRELLATLTHEPHHIVTGVAWHSPTQLYSLSANNTVVEWNVLTGKRIRCVEVSGGTSLCSLDRKNLCVGRNNIEHLFLKNKGNEAKLKKVLTGHTSQVCQLLPLPTLSDPLRYFLSAAHDDRFVYAWDLMSESEEPVASFKVGEIVVGMEAVELQDNTVSLAVTTKKGSLVVFTQHLNGNTSSKAVKRLGQLRIIEEGKKKNPSLPIIATFFCCDTDNSLIIAYGHNAIIKFERISMGEISGDIKLTRNAPAATTTKEPALANILTPKVTRDATVVGPGHLSVPRPEAKRKYGDEDGTTALPMGERLNALALHKPTKQAATEPPKADNQVHLLLQGLHSKDQRILQEVLACGDEEAVTKTVQRLPVPAVVPLLKYLQTLFVNKGHKSAAYVTWVRMTLYHHMSHLSTLSDRQELLQPFYSASVSRTATLTQLTELHARLDLSLTHVAIRHQEAEQSHVEPEALLIYREESSDEEDLMEGIVGVSESEDNWEELSDFGEVNGHTDSDSEPEASDGHLTTAKRKLEASASGSEEEDEEEDEDEEESNGGESDPAMDHEDSDSDDDGD